LVICGQIQADIILTTGTGNGSDSYVNAGANQNTNYGSNETALELMGSANDFLRKAYFRFDLSSVPGPITEASLSFRINSPDGNTGGGPVRLYGLNDAVEGESWAETGINWNNAPANAGGPSLTSDATFLA